VYIFLKRLQHIRKESSEERFLLSF